MLFPYNRTYILHGPIISVSVLPNKAQLISIDILLFVIFVHNILLLTFLFSFFSSFLVNTVWTHQILVNMLP